MATSVPGTDKRKSRHTCWTLNNWRDIHLTRLSEYVTESRYICWSQEVGEEGTPHLQGYVAWDNPRSLKKFKDTITPPGEPQQLHYEPYTKGTAAQNRAYCAGLVQKKGNVQNPTFEEHGELPQQGERTDWTAAVQELCCESVSTVVERQPQLLPAIRALERYKQLSLRPLNRDVKVTVIIGPPGTGKSKYAYDTDPDLYSKPDGQWFDGYTGQKTLLLDDFYGDLPYSTLLKVLDRYPLQVPVKGGFVYAQWTHVIITSNREPQQWNFPPFTDLAAFNRRVTETIYKTQPDGTS